MIYYNRYSLLLYEFDERQSALHDFFYILKRSAVGLHWKNNEFLFIPRSVQSIYISILLFFLFKLSHNHKLPSTYLQIHILFLYSRITRFIRRKLIFLNLFSLTTLPSHRIIIYFTLNITHYIMIVWRQPISTNDGATSTKLFLFLLSIRLWITELDSALKLDFKCLLFCKLFFVVNSTCNHCLSLYKPIM